MASRYPIFGFMSLYIYWRAMGVLQHKRQGITGDLARVFTEAAHWQLKACVCLTYGELPDSKVIRAKASAKPLLGDS